ncbi:DEAD/DEAH box helicase family protein [Empedobacter falsenii]
MNQNTINQIKQRLSLRLPLAEALEVTATIADHIPLNKTKRSTTVQEDLQVIKGLYPSCTDFQRAFPSITHNIATGVGKTRLMGAIITYLYLAKGVKNFFILAPNLTIYEKLIKDFGDPAYSKYVFNGISEFVHNRPVIITGDNYAQQGALFSESEVRINIFNISKFNSDNKGQKKGGVALAPKMKRLSEYLGESYWQHLSSLDDLVVLMDEAHRYHADASKKAIDELNPVFGIELTATPTDEKGKSFKNIVYEYTLAKALADGLYVKNPTIAKRKNFDSKKEASERVEQVKLEDAISIHQQTKTDLELYSLNNDEKLVKPFVLVVCKDIPHAKAVYDYINSSNFYEGQYIDKVLQIDSSTKKDEEIEQLFVSLENPDNEIEIVIHVNMLKEGWDVSNLYTIVPLRAANASVLIEQTIGRGLRLPFGGKRTGEANIDKLTVIAHDNFDAVIAEAQNPESILNKISFIEFDEDEVKEKTIATTSVSKAEKEIEEEQAKVDAIVDVQEKQTAQNQVDAKKAIISVLPTLNKIPEIKKVEDFAKPEAKAKVIEQLKETFNQGQGNLFADDIVKEAETIYETVVSNYKKQIIEIPRMDLVQGDAHAYFEDFDLDTSVFQFKALEDEIIRVSLANQAEVESLRAISSGNYGNPINNIIAELLNYSDVDYDDNAELLHKLAKQAYSTIEASNSDEKDMKKAVFQFKKTIADRIYLQMKNHFKIEYSNYEKPHVLPFTKIESHNFSALASNGFKDYRDIISPVSLVPKYVFTGFEKACHFEYKFDSNTEKELAFVLENDRSVIKWLRPASNQFRIYWDNNSKRYEPDFVVETEDAIYMIEPKSKDKMQDSDVLQKADAAITYCKYATEYNLENGGKPWHYLLIPHDEINKTINFAYLLNKFLTK